MTAVHWAQTPLGRMLLASDGEALVGAWFENQKYFCPRISQPWQERTLPIFDRAQQWLNSYFAGECPEEIPVKLPEGTPFQMAVWRLLQEIPRGQTVTYGELARRMAAQSGGGRMSAQAVGGAVGRNPISLWVPCHRVVGSDGSLTGYAGGMERKRALLQLEGIAFLDDEHIIHPRF